MINDFDNGILLPVWDKLNDAEKAVLIEGMSEKSFLKGQTITHTSFECMGAMLVVSGQLRVYIVSEDGREVTLYRLYAGDLCTLSASCVLDDIAFDVIVEAMTDTNLKVFTSASLQTVKSSNARFEAYLYKVTAERLSEVVLALQSVIFLSTHKRLAKFLLSESKRTNSDCLDYTHEQLATLVGSAREVVGKALKYFEQDGLVSVGRKKIVITDKKNLQNLAE